MTPTTLLLVAARRLVPLAAFLIPAGAAAQQGPAPDTAAVRLKAVSVTATRSETDVHNLATPVSVLDADHMKRRAPATIVELFRDMPGVDVVGVGANQLRPAIRGQRGQRILLLENGLRLGNTRRQQDFGELPGLVDVTALDRVEVVRGPASVLYGSDAIGGVMNLITTTPAGRVNGSDFSGRIGYRYGDAGASNRGDGSLAWRFGGFSLQAGGSLREAGSYKAPAGSYGNVTLGDDTRVQDTGVDDRTLNGYLGWRSSTGHEIFARAEQYHADDAGFGFVEPSLLGDESRIQILYPKQSVARLTAGTNTGILNSVFASRANIALYRQTNGRDLAQNIWVPFGPGTPPGAGVDIETRNRTDVTTVGFRAEAARIFSSNILTYGVDFFRDDARGRDSSVTSVIGFGPPMTEVSTRSQVPNAALSSLGIFVQNDMRLHDRFSLVAGGRFQRTRSSPRSTESDLEGVTNSTAVYSLNGLFRATDALNLVASLGRGFRAPNLVERYFDGPTPEGSAYQSATPDLKPEQSLNIDLGAKLQGSCVSAELSVFQNRITNGIRIAFAGDSIDRLPRYENVNVTALRIRGAEFAVTALLSERVSASANWSRLLSRNLSDPALPVGDVYASKTNATLGYRAPAGRWWAEYAVRYNGRQRQIVAGSSPVGDELPAFTVHSVRGGLVPWTTRGMRQELGLQINNFTNELYAEVANAGFFRPEVKRNVVVTITTWF